MKRRDRRFGPETLTVGTLESRQMLSVAGFEATTQIPHLIGHVSRPTQQPTATHAARAGVAAYDGQNPFAKAVARHDASHATAASSGRGLDATTGLHYHRSQYQGHPASPSTSRLAAASVATPDPSAGMMPAAATDPNAYDPYTGPASSMACTPGETKKVDVVIFQLTNNTANSAHWETTYSKDQEISVEGTATIGGKIFSGGIKGSYKSTDKTETKLSGDLPKGETIVVIAHYTFRCVDKPGWGLKTFSSSTAWVGTIDSVSLESSLPTNIDNANSGQPKPQPSPQS